LLGELLIPKVDEKTDEMTDVGEKITMTIESNEIAYIKFIFPIDVETGSIKVAFNITKGFKTKDYPDGNGAIT
jgi:hypothetical protein